MVAIIKRSTSNFNLGVPFFNMPGWGAAFERNMDIIDAVLSTTGAVGNIVGTWTNNTVYGVDDRVVDAADNTVWQAAVAHTSALTGTFVADRATNPTYWDIVTTNIVVREQFVTGSDYFIGDFVYDTTQQMAGIVQTAFTGGASLRTHIASLGVIYDLQADLGQIIHAAANDATPDDADEFGIWDSTTAILGHVTWANIKVAIFTAIGALTGKTTPIDADTIPLSDSAAAGVGKSLTFANLKATLFNTSLFRLRDNADATKLLAVDLSALTTATTRTQIVPDENGRQALSAHLSGHLYGLTLANNAGDATNDIDIAIGNAIDSTNVHVMTLASALTKRLDAAWAVGTNQGGLDTGSIADTTYHMFLIKRIDTGVVDVLFSASATAPTMPTNYTLFRRIGSVLRVAGALVAFVQTGDLFMRAAPVLDVNATNPGTSAVTRTLSVPTGIQVKAKVGVGYTAGVLADMPAVIYISALNTTDIAPSGSTTYSLVIYSAATLINNTGIIIEVMTNTSAQVRSRIQISAGGTVLHISTLGWTDTRGRI